MSRMSAACANRSVSRASSGLGVGSPLGWLCTTSSAVVPGVRHAGTNTSGSEMGVLERVPRESTCQARRRWRVERHATAKTSTVSLASSGASVAAAIRGSLRACVGSRTAWPWSSRSVRYVQTNSRTRCPRVRLSCVVGDMSDLLSGGRSAALWAHVSQAATAVSAVAGLNGWMGECVRPSETASRA